jgi:hypothetical protein
MHGATRHERVRQRAGPVPIQAAVLHQGQSLVREGIGVVPIVAHDRYDAALGENDREERHGARADGDVEGMREERVGAVEITVEQVGDALGVQHNRSVRAGRAESGHGELGVASHLCDPAAAE